MTLPASSVLDSKPDKLLILALGAILIFNFRRPDVMRRLRNQIEPNGPPAIP